MREVIIPCTHIWGSCIVDWSNFIAPDEGGGVPGGVRGSRGVVDVEFLGCSDLR